MDTRIHVLIDRWEASGKALTPVELCADCPELLAELSDAITALSAVDAALLSKTLDPGPLSPTRHDPPHDIPGYANLRLIGSGGQAVVYSAVKVNTGRSVAVKVLLRQVLPDQRQLDRFDREVMILAAMNHPNIVQIIDRGVTPDGAHFLVMDYVEGKRLDQFLADEIFPRMDADGADDRGRMLGLFVKICRAVDAAHEKGIIHRDLKPHNIIVDTRNEPHILDFGVARSSLEGFDERSISLTNHFIGTPAWSSPEQAESRELDRRSDVYALGLILYYMLTGGHFPYNVRGSLIEVLDNIRRVRPVPPGEMLVAKRAKEPRDGPMRERLKPVLDPVLDAIVLKTLSKDAGDRFPGARDLAEAIEKQLAERQRAAANPRRVAPRFWLIIGGAIAAMVVVAALWNVHEPIGKSNTIIAQAEANSVAGTSSSSNKPERNERGAPQAPSQASVSSVFTPPTSINRRRRIAHLGPPATSISIDPNFVKRTIQLIPLIDPTLDAEGGEWQVGDGVLSGSSSGGSYSVPFNGHETFKINLPYCPPPVYDVRLSFTPTLDMSSGQQIRLMLFRGGRPFDVLLDAREADKPHVFMLCNLGSFKSPGVCKTAREKGFESGHQYRVAIHVGLDSVVMELNGEKILEFPNKVPPLANPETGRPSIQGEFGGSILFNSIDVDEISGPGTLIEREPDDPNLDRRFPAARSAINQVEFLGDDNHVAARSINNNVLGGFGIWDRRTGKSACYPCTMRWPMFDGGRYLVAGDCNYFMTVNVASGAQVLFQRLSEPTAMGRTSELSPDGRFIANWQFKETRPTRYALELRDRMHPEEIHTLGGMGPEAQCRFTPDSKVLLVFQPDDTIWAWQVDSARELWHRSIKLLDRDQPLCLSPDSAYVCVGQRNEKENILAVKSGEVAGTFNFGGKTMAFSPDGNFLVTGGVLRSGANGAFNSNSPLQLWEVPGGREIPHFSCKFPGVQALAFSAKGDRLLVGDGVGAVTLIDFATGRQLAEFWGHKGAVTCLAFSSDGAMAASGGTDRIVRVWRLPARSAP